MAREFSGTSQGLFYGAATPSAYPVSFSVWCKPDVDPGAATCGVGIGSSSGGSDAIICGIAGSLKGGWWIRNNAEAQNTGQTVNTMSVNTWGHVAFVAASATSRTVWLNGDDANKATSATSKNFPAADRVGVGISPRSPGTTHPFDGSVAEVGIWNIALTLEDVTQLAAGVSPELVKPHALVRYIPLINENDVDHRRSDTITLQGTPTWDSEDPIHPPVKDVAGPGYMIEVPAVAAGLAIPILLNQYRRRR